MEKLPGRMISKKFADLYKKDKKKIVDKFMTVVKKMTYTELENVYKFTKLLKTHSAEAGALYARIDKNAVAAEEYMRDNPPSAGAIALLVTIAQVGMKSEQAKKNAHKMLATDPKQAAKLLVYRSWLAWQDDKAKQLETYEGKSAFAKDMLYKHEALDSQTVIVRWCGAWEKENSTQLAG